MKKPGARKSNQNARKLPSDKRLTLVKVRTTAAEKTSYLQAAKRAETKLGPWIRTTLNNAVASTCKQSENS